MSEFLFWQFSGSSHHVFRAVWTGYNSSDIDSTFIQLVASYFEFVDVSGVEESTTRLSEDDWFWWFLVAEHD